MVYRWMFGVPPPMTTPGHDNDDLRLLKAQRIAEDFREEQPGFGPRGRLFTVGLGSHNVGADEEFLRALSGDSQDAYMVSDDASLVDIFNRIGRSLPCPIVQVDRN